MLPFSADMDWDWKFWFTAATNCVGLWLMWRTLKATLPSSGSLRAVGGTLKMNWLRRYWAVVVMMLLFTGCWIPYLLSKNTIPRYNPQIKSVEVVDQRFANEVVRLDGKSFVHG